MVIMYLLIGCVAGILSGLFGIGGGRPIVPALLPVGVSDIMAWLLLGVGLFFGAPAGVRLASVPPEATLQGIFAASLVAAAARLRRNGGGQ